MDFGRGISIQEDKGLKFQGRWVPVTPAKPIPTRPRTTITGERGRPNWVASMHLPPEFLHGTPSIPITNVTCHNSTASVDQHMGFNTWESRNKASELIMNPYAQAINNVNPNLWNNLPFQDLLALADAASGVPTTSAREQNNAANGRYFPFYIPENDNNQLQSNPANTFVEQNYSIGSNLRNNGNQQQQMLQHGFPVPYRSMYDLNSSPRTMYDLNSTPSTIADVITNGNLSFKSTPVTPDKGSRMQHNQLSGTCSNGGNTSFQFASLSPDMGSKMQHSQTFGSVSHNVASFQFESLTSDKGARMPYNQFLEAVTNGNTLLQFVPSTPDKGGTVQQGQLSELVNNFQDERTNQGKNKLHEDIIPEGDKNIELHSSQESCLENSSPAALEKQMQPTSGSSCVARSLEENQNLAKGEENGIDLNKTPQQKPRKKKHRPRVVIEGKPKRTPKSTVKQNDPKETKTVKRKYVRRNTSNTPSTDVVGKNNGAKQFASAKTCKRSLNFDSEAQGHESHGKTPRHQEETPQSNLGNTADYLAFENLSEPQGTNLCSSRNEGSSGTMTLQSSHELDVMTQNSLVDFAFDLNRSAMQVLGEYISLPEITPQPTRRELLRENLKVLARNGHVPRAASDNQNYTMKHQQELGHPDVLTGNVVRNFEGSVSSRLQSNIHLESGGQHNLIGRQNQSLAGNGHHNASKRAHSQISEEARARSYNLIGTHMNSMKIYHEMLRGSEDHRNGVMLFPEIYKKRRTEKNHNMTTARKIHVATLGYDQKEMAMHYIKNANAQLSTLLGNSSQHYTANNTETLRIGANSPMRGYCSVSLPSGDIQGMQNIPAAPLSCAEEPQPQKTAFDKQKSSELMLTIRQTEMTTGKRSKGHTRVRDLATLTSVAQCNNLQSNMPRSASTSHDKSIIGSVQRTGYIMPSPCDNKHADMAITKYRRRSSKSNMVSFSNEMRVQDHQTALSGNLHYPAKSRGSLEVAQTFNSPIDELVQRLERLRVTSDSNKVSTEEQTALVPYKGDDRIVPYEGIFDAIKKKKARPKVDLDLETDRVWKLLMGKEASDDVEGTSAEKERWWEEERHVFRGRADSFIARMHLIQGDRRFTRWNGSVLDSVIGVFLTQNVSDHLSSSAFMSLAARFPLKPTRDDITLREEVAQVNVEEPEVVVVDSATTIWHAKLPPEPVVSQDSQGSITIQEADQVEDKEVCSTSPNSSGETLEVVESTLLFCKKYPMGKTDAESIMKEQVYLSTQETVTTYLEEPEVVVVDSANTKWNAKLPPEPAVSQDSQGSITIQEADRVEDKEVCSTSPNSSGGTLDVESTLLLGKKDPMGNTDAESIIKESVYLSTQETATTSSKPSPKLGKEKKTVDWDYLRKDAYKKCRRRERNHDTMDSLDWEAVRCANVNEIANAIKERGMNNMLADRIKDFLNRLVRDHEEIDLEWLRDVPPDKAKEYLLSVRGLGLKSVECVRLLTLHQLAFPVDTNVGRIAVRLGWVPLQPLPESLQLHLLELYPVLETIQKYLWPRLCTLDQQTLYELHYQLITFGKVFCTKSKPNCNACPMRAECKHFASAYASARLALPGPEEKGIVSSTVLPMANQNPVLGISQLALPPSETNMLSETRTRVDNSEPIIEVPASPEPEYNEMLESDIEDATFFEDPDEIPTIKLSIEDFAMNLQNYMQENNMALQDGDVSKALVALNPEAASIPTPRLKNVSRLRTEHQVYELPDSHPLLKGLEKRVPGEVSSYLLAIWTPGETADSTQPPEGCCSSQMSGNLCSETCFSCNNAREANSQTVRGTLLIPCKTAMRGSFPLNGTYFQVNEVFADHDSSLKPIDVPRSLLWNLPRRTVYFGTSIPTIFKGQTTEQIQSCFWRGFVCVRGFDQKSRAPRPLMARLHFPASRLIANKLVARTKAKKDE